VEAVLGCLPPPLRLSAMVAVLIIIIIDNGYRPSATTRAGGRGLHSFTSQLNLSALCGMGVRIRVVLPV